LENEEVFENIVNWLSEHKVFVPRSALDNLKLKEIEEIDSLILISLILEIEILKTRKFNLDNMVEINNYTLQELIQSI
jgi:hypothetical protein